MVLFELQHGPSINTELLGQWQALGYGLFRWSAELRLLLPFDLASDELIRWASPTAHFRRTATRDFEMHGAKVRAGDKVVLWFLSGNRDADAFHHADRIDLTRKPNRHVSFGQGGPHVCLGMWLAKLEVNLVLQEMAKSLRSIEQTAPHAYLRSNFIHGIKRLPVRVHPK